MKKLPFSILVTLILFHNTLQAQWKSANGPAAGDTSVISSLTSASIGSMVTSGNVVFVTTGGMGYGELFSSADNGNTWIINDSLPKGNSNVPNGNLSSLISADSEIFVQTYTSGEFLSGNHGNTWAAMNRDPTGQETKVFANNGSEIYGSAYSSELFTSTDNGNSWNLLYAIRQTDHQAFGINSVTVGGTCILVGADWWDPCSPGGGYEYFFSPDNGATWSGNYSAASKVPIGVDNYDDSYGADLAACGSNLFLSVQNQGLYLSGNNGNTWSLLTNDLPPQFCPALFVYDTNIIAGDNNHLLLSGNNGNSWTDIGEGLPFPLGINAYTVCEDYLFIGTNGSGVWKRPLSEVIPGYVNKYADTPATDLTQNDFKVYPNPANNLLYFKTTSSEETDIKIFNSIGSLVIETKQALNCGLDISSLPVGVYVAEINVNNTLVKQKWVKM
jgi:photosystem II stability/assembly factor-like uncharacterized protein